MNSMVEGLYRLSLQATGSGLCNRPSCDGRCVRWSQNMFALSCLRHWFQWKQNTNYADENCCNSHLRQSDEAQSTRRSTSVLAYRRNHQAAEKQQWSPQTIPPCTKGLSWKRVSERPGKRHGEPWGMQFKGPRTQDGGSSSLSWTTTPGDWHTRSFAISCEAQ